MSVISSKPNVSNNLLLNAIASPRCDVNNPDAKGALLNRVKKLNDADRTELMGYLGEVKKRIDPSYQAPPNEKPLKGRGIASVLFHDDGLKVDKPCFIIAMIRGVLNFLGLRHGSDSIMNEIKDIREKLLKANLKSNPMLPDQALNGMLTRLNEKSQKINDPSATIKTLHDKINKATEAFTEGSKSEKWGSPSVFMAFRTALKDFTTQLDKSQDIPANTKKGI